jgi:hypothetical protein
MANNKIMTPAEFYCSKGYIDKSNPESFLSEAFIPMPEHVTEYAEYYHAEMSRPPKDVEEAIDKYSDGSLERYNKEGAGFVEEIEDAVRFGFRIGKGVAAIEIQEAYKDGYLKHVSGSRCNLGPALQALAEEYARQKCQQKDKEGK